MSNAKHQTKHLYKQSVDEHTRYSEEIENLFNKKCIIQKPLDWTLPKPVEVFTSDPWSIQSLQTLKSKLNFHKSQLNDYCIEDWRVHTTKRNSAGDVNWKLRANISPEFPTQAWTKFYECASSYDILPDAVKNGKEFASLHLCEAPGAFITSLNHFLKLNHPSIKWKWLATTLNPYYEGNSLFNMISDDRFMLHTLDNWHFGADNTGDLMNWANSQSLIARTRELGKVYLVTADGSIDCSMNPGDQEEVVAALHFCEVITALQCLSEGGTLICKIFTMFEHSTVNLLYLLTILFDETNIYKPATSKEGNSEVYIVCLRYHEHLLHNYAEAFSVGYGTDIFNSKCLFPLESIPVGFIEQVKECAGYFSSLQCHVIDNNVISYQLGNQHDYNYIKRLKSFVSREFFERYNLKPIPHDMEVLSGLLHEDVKMNINPRHHFGSFTDKTLFAEMSVAEKLASVRAHIDMLLGTYKVFFQQNDLQWCNLYDDKSILNLSFKTGKKFYDLKSSKFVFAHIFMLYKKLNDIVCSEKKFYLEIDTRLPEHSVLKKEEYSVLKMETYKGDESYDDYEKSCLNCLYEKLKTMDRNSSLYLINYNCFTQFSVGVLHVLARKTFKEIGFTNGYGLFLNNFVDVGSMDLLKNIVDKCKTLSDLEDASVVGVLPSYEINTGSLYNQILVYNSTLLRNVCLKFLDSF